MPTIRVIRTWEVTIPQKVLDELQEKDFDTSDLLYTLTDMANSGDFEPVYYVEFMNEEFSTKGLRNWGGFNDTHFGDEGKDFKVLYGPLESWDAKEQAWTTG